MIEAYLSNQVEDLDEDGNVFVVDDDVKADWCIKKISELQKELDRLVTIGEAEITNIQEKIALEQERFEKKTRYYKYQLWNYFNFVEHNETKTQESYKLLSGSLVMKKASQRMVQDDKSLLDFLKSSGYQEYVQTIEKPKWGEFKKNLSIVDGKVIDSTTGEWVKCIEVEDVAEQFDIKL